MDCLKYILYNTADEVFSHCDKPLDTEVIGSVLLDVDSFY